MELKLKSQLNSQAHNNKVNKLSQKLKLSQLKNQLKWFNNQNNQNNNKNQPRLFQLEKHQKIKLN